MSGAYRGRAAHPSANAPASAAAAWEQEWRADVTRQLDDSAEKHEKAGVILERLTNRLDEHDRRISALEERPQQAREARLGERNLTAQLWLVGCGLLTVLAYLLPHLSFH